MIEIMQDARELFLYEVTPHLQSSKPGSSTLDYAVGSPQLR